MTRLASRRATLRRRVWILAWTAAVYAIFIGPAAAEELIGYAPCHKVAMTRTENTLENGSVLSVWRATTCLEDVNDELRSLTDAFAARHKQSLTELSGAEGAKSRLDVKIMYGRTGVSWLSFMVSARVALSGADRTIEIATRTYDMKTGERIRLKDVFDENSAVWGIVEAGVRKTFLRYYPDSDRNTRVMEQLLKRDNLREADFTLHGMSLVLHYPAPQLFEGKFSIVHVPFYYLELYGHMTPRAFAQTDNKRYYKMASLTYDDGPSREGTPRLLNTLMEKGVRATFFISGNALSQGEEERENVGLARRERDEGHAIGGRNWLSADVSGWPAAAIRAIRPKVDAALTEAVGVPSAYNRAPYGKYKPLVESKAAWPLIQWSVDPDDTPYRLPEDILDSVTRQTTNGDIILLHDSNPRCDVYTGMIVDKLEDDGYLFLTVDEMFAKDRVPFLENLVYYRCVNGDFSEKK